MNSDHVILSHLEGSSQKPAAPAASKSAEASEADKTLARAKRPWLGIAVLLLYFAALTVAMFGDLLTSSRAVWSAASMDVDLHVYDIRSFAFGEMAAGRLPLWNPYSFGGMPALANFTYALLYPPNWMHLVLPTALAMNINGGLHFFLAGLFTALWCRSRGCGIIASLVGGSIFVLASPYVLNVYAGHPTYLAVLTWSPLVFLAVDQIIAWPQRAPLAMLLGVLAVTMQVLAGSPQPAYYTALGVLVYAAVQLLGQAPRAWLRSIGWISAMYAIAGALSAAQVLPGLAAAREGLRQGALPYEVAASFSLAPENLLTLLAPFPFGDDFAIPYLGRWLLWDATVYVGPAALILAACGIACCTRPRDRAAWVVAGLALLIALGWNTPLHRLLYAVVPLFDRFRAPARFGFLVVLMLAVLAASGFDAVLQWQSPHPDPHRRRRRWIAVTALLVALVVGCVALALRRDGGRSGGIWQGVLSSIRATGETTGTPDYDAAGALVARSAAHASAQLAAAAFALAQVSAALLLAQRFRLVAIAIPVLLVLQMTATAAPSIQRVNPHRGAPPEWQATLDSRGADARVLTTSPGHPNLMTQLRVEDAWGYDPAAPSRWVNLVAPLIGSDPSIPAITDFQVHDVKVSPLWSMLRVTRFLPPAGHPWDGPPLPRALLVDRAIVTSGPHESLAAVRAAGFDPRRAVVLETQPNPPPAQGSAPSHGPSGTVSVRRIDTDTLEIHADLNRAAILLITDGYGAGWRARSLGASPQSSYDVLPANHALRAIPLAAGSHHLILEYAPRSVTIGLWISAVAWLGLAIAMISWWLKERIQPQMNADKRG